MNFDKTYIAIRQRSIFEILDLALHVIRGYFVPLSVLLVIGVAPLFVINWLLLGWMVTDTNSFEYSYLYVWGMLFLVLNQAHVGTTFITYYLGQAIFEGRPSVSSTIKNVFQTLTFFVWAHGGLRFVLLVLIFALLLRENLIGTEQFAFLFSAIVIFTSIGLLVRALRPFASEMLLLERTPIFNQGDETIVTYSTRSSALHNAAGPELFGRFTLMFLLSFPLVFMVYSTLVLTDQMLNLHIDPETTVVTWYWPIALWIVAGFMAVVRFLSYLDIRIRQEGWAVELRVRAEAIRLSEALES